MSPPTPGMVRETMSDTTPTPSTDLGPRPSAMSDRELIERTYMMVHAIYSVVQEAAPAITRISDDVRTGGLAGLMGAMMTGMRGGK